MAATAAASSARAARTIRLRPGLGRRLDRGPGCPPRSGVPTIALPGRRPSMVVETELSPPPAVIVTSPKRSPYSRPSFERSSTWIEMKAGTRTTRGVMRPFSAVNSASVRAGSSSPAPPGSSSGDSRPARSPPPATPLCLGLRRRLGLGARGLRHCRRRGRRRAVLVVPAAPGNRQHKRNEPVRRRTSL